MTKRYRIGALLLVFCLFAGCARVQQLPNPTEAEHIPGTDTTVSLTEQPTSGATVSQEAEPTVTEGMTGAPTLTEVPKLTGSGSSTEDTQPETTTTPTGDVSYIIVLDPGHGGSYTGAVYNGKQEKDLNLKIACYLRDYLEKNYDVFTVYLTREEDVKLARTLGEDLLQRVLLAEEVHADVLVSLHLNASEDHKQYGAMVCCPHRETVKTAAYALANCILAELEELGIKNNGAQKRNSKDTFDENGNPVEYYAINRHTADRGIPGIIVEHCFMDNNKDSAFIQDDEAIQSLGEADARGIAAYFGY